MWICLFLPAALLVLFHLFGNPFIKYINIEDYYVLLMNLALDSFEKSFLVSGNIVLKSTLSDKNIAKYL